MGWYRELVDTGRAQAAWMLFAFFVTFTVTRAVTRRIRAKHGQARASAAPAEEGGLSDVYIGGVHIHHQVWGILMVMLAGLLQFRYAPDSPWAEVLAVIFGAGAALTLDEFALWLHLDDVYWGPQGRKSIDAILLGGALGVVLLTQTSPIGAEPERAGSALSEWTYFGGIGFHLVMAVFCFLKGKLATGLIGIVVPVVAFVGAVRLAKPSSVWALHRYGGRKEERSRNRFGATYDKRWNRVRDLLGGHFS
ncbi:hypothetical protein ACIBL3_22865 [Kribbella sp. NPDC050124]|uniref:hypothetical protein n=1 Tax=Kribbella sp. NPDC050124 TaxID=3364114 RepID=UPI0037BC8945